MQSLKPLLTFESLPTEQRTGFQILVQVSLILCVLSFLLTTSLLFLYPYSANYGEAPILDQAIHLASGQNIYKPSLQSPPYVISNYTPLYPFLIDGLHQALRLPWIKSGRIISILAAAASSILLGSLAGKLFRNRVAGFLAAGFFLGHPFISLWSGLVRVDSLALTFSLSALWIVYNNWRSSAWLALALVCLLASIFTRQTYLLASPLACGVWLLYNDRKRAVIFLAALTGLGILIFLVIDTITQGGFFKHIVTANVNTYSLERLFSMALLWIISAPLLIILAIFAVRQISFKPTDPFLVWGILPFCAGVLLTALTVGKVGSDENYFLEITSASALLAAGLWAIKPGKTIYISMIVNCVWLVTLSGVLFQAPIIKMWNNIPGMKVLAQQVQAASRNGPVLADDRLDLVLFSGQPIYYQPFEYTQLYNAGLWDASAFEREIASHKFSLILIRPAYQQERWPAPIYDAIRQHYTCNLQTSMLVCQP